VHYVAEKPGQEMRKLALAGCISLAVVVAGCGESVCVWTVAAFWAAPVGDAVAARVAADDRGAVYSPRLDPLIHGGVRLTGSRVSPEEGEFGHSVALSSDGNTALVGAPDENGRVGAVWVFTRSGATWTQQGTQLTGSGEIGAGSFGSSVALSANGNVALIGGRSDNTSPKEPCCLEFRGFRGFEGARVMVVVGGVGERRLSG